ncbi:HTH-type transcriptional regulator CysB [Pseudoalteromonas holothuriae]|uniref:HTH-type transcriptional regulator CysB n=1 Tax=Pseudoalteromonas holothuriae TaxID=2963714 RepID=A0A9W4R3W9_9GAMM|nr:MULTISPECIES: LysR family transcriptional regulator [unclassified Pseudoalteromonas]CAH9065284.1 HTH-type transcriptional regulator CysB [Pseudoalteromonas sp. CIP111854]CAH9066463.1 HTH-type transcriptional regulator CysB [Pseudoalteromonas sp. CIP111951]
MKIADLEILHAVAKTHSLSEAALRLHRTQPAVTQALKRLEEQLGFKIVNRDNYRVTLTQEGRRFCDESAKLLVFRDDLHILAKEFSAGNEAQFNICYEPLCYQAQYNDVISDIFKQFKHTEMAITSGKRFVALEQVNNADADLGIGPWFDLFHATGDLESIAIGDIHLGLVAKKGLLPTKLCYEQLASYPSLAMFESGFNFDSERLAYAKGANMIKLDDIASIKSFLLTGTGFAMISLSHCQAELDAGLLEQIEVLDRQCTFTAKIHAFRKQVRHHGPVARAIWQKFQKIGAQYAKQ